MLLSAFATGCLGTERILSTSSASHSRAELTFDVEVFGDLDADRKRGLVRRIEEAFDFALQAHGWVDRAFARQRFVVRLRAKPGARRTSAVTKGPGSIDVSLGSEESGVDGVLAHELSHLLDFRAAGERILQVPRYFEEGKALAVGRARRRALGDDADDAWRARYLATAPVEHAERAFASFGPGRGVHARATEEGMLSSYMSIGVFFVDFLDGKLPPGGASAVRRLAQAVEAVGNGDEFGSAFARSFGFSLQEAQRQFIEHLAGTEGAPERRLAGSPYARFLRK